MASCQQCMLSQLAKQKLWHLLKWRDDGYGMYLCYSGIYEEI